MSEQLKGVNLEETKTSETFEEINKGLDLLEESMDEMREISNKNWKKGFRTGYWTMMGGVVLGFIVSDQIRKIVK